MGLREEVEKIYSDNTNYKNPGQAVNQASSINALSSDLYTDSKRFIYELLQNADDSSENGKQVKVWIKIFNDTLVVAHSGSPFTTRDLQGICNINNGTKKSDINKTGYKGIGFKSVFGQSDKVTIFSNNEYFRFDAKFSFKWLWGDSIESWEKINDRKFQFPWQIIPIYTEINEIDQPIHEFLLKNEANVATLILLKNVEETKNAIRSLTTNLNMFIFLKKISEIHFDVDKKIIVQINKLGIDRISLTKRNQLESEWLIKNLTLKVPNDVKVKLQDERNIPEKLLMTDSIELSLAAKIENNNIKKLSNDEKLLYSYLPTDEAKYALPVLVNTSFLTTANRESLHSDSKWNQWLFKEIAIEIFNWISEIVQTEYQSQAYDLIPEKTINDELGMSFNQGMSEALNNTNFVVDRSNQLVKVKNSIVDFTYLSEKKFIGEEPIKEFLVNSASESLEEIQSFAKYSGYFSTFKKLGASFFEWKDIERFLKSKYFTRTHSIINNIELIKHFKQLSESEKVKEISEKTLSKLPFIWDHKNTINYPSRVCIPTPDDQNWDNPNNELSFLHRDLQEWLSREFTSRKWLERLGVKEKTDITYIEQTIIPQIDKYITHDNAIKTVRELYNLYKKESLNSDILKKLAKIKLLTLNGTLCPAEECFLSDFYSPRIKMEDTLEMDIYVTHKYCTSNIEKGEWKYFLLQLGVNEGIVPTSYQNRSDISTLKRRGLKCEYFETSEKRFSPFVSTFKADEFSNINSIKYIDNTINNLKFAKIFWSDYIDNYDSLDIRKPTTAYWGNTNRPGRLSGNDVENYIPWFVKNNKCIPTLIGKCEVSSNVFLNTEEIKFLAGEYLEVFDGPELSSDWKSFFKFKTNIELSDYLNILSSISQDLNDKGAPKIENNKRIQKIYSILMKDCINWGADEIQEVEEWANTGRLLNSKKQFTKCTELKYFIDGNENIFQDQYDFLLLNAENKNNPNLEIFLKYLKVNVLMQNEFSLVHTQENVCLDMKEKLFQVIPYFISWVESEDKDETILSSLGDIHDKINGIEFLEATELKITYQDIDFTKNVNIHFDEKRLFVTKPWNANSVLLKLPEILCRLLNLVGHDKKLDFLLRSEEEEIQMYFEQEELNIPEEALFRMDKNDNEAASRSKKVNSFADLEVAISEKKISPEFFHLSNHDYKRLKYIETLIPRAVTNIIEHLKLLPNYDCSNYYKIANSVIGGVRKNGNEITIVARPSDDDKVLIYYTSEFDVLEYIDAELWCEDGVTIPKQITFGSLLRKTGINRIPVRNIDLTDLEIEDLLGNAKSEKFDFDVVPYTPQKLAKIIASFANTGGGTIIFGIKEINSISNEIIGLSTDFQVLEITKKAISLLSPIPSLDYDWHESGGKNVFIIKVEKEEDGVVLFEKEKYIRVGTSSILAKETKDSKTELCITSVEKTVAIIISIENYKSRKENQVPKVKYATNDAEQFKEVLMKSMNVEEDDIYMIIDEDALKSTLEYELKSLFNSLTEKDRLIFYYVGHGFHNGITNYLSTYDMHQYNIPETAVSLRKVLIDPLMASKCNNALIFIDACAQSFKDENIRGQLTNIIDEELILVLNEFPYYGMFLSCQPGQSSYSSDILMNGIWTHHLVKGISGKISECLYSNKYVTDRLLNDYLSTSVPQYVIEELGYNQNPKAILDSNRENVISEINRSE